MNAAAREKSIFEQSVEAVNREMGDNEPVKARPAKKEKVKPTKGTPKARAVKKKGKRPGRPAGPDPVAPVNVTIPKGLHKKAKDKAEAEGVTFSSAVARLLAAWVEGK